MLPKKNRLARIKVEHILKKGEKQSYKHFNAKFLKGTTNEDRFAVVVSTKIYPKAVDRNKLRRQIYEIIRLYKHKSSKALDIIIFAKTPVTELNYTEIQETINHILKKLHE